MFAAEEDTALPVHIIRQRQAAHLRRGNELRMAAYEVTHVLAVLVVAPEAVVAATATGHDLDGDAVADLHVASVVDGDIIGMPASS